MTRKIAIVLGVLAVAGVLAYAKLKPSALRPAEPAQKEKGGAAPRALTVTGSRLKPVPLRDVIAVTGTLRAEESVDLLSEISGKIVTIGFEEGERVRKGDVLIKLNDIDLRASLDRAQRRRSLAELKERRLTQLRENNFSTQQEYDEALNELNVQRAEVAIAEAMVAKTEIRAPFDGVMGLRAVSVGAFVNTSTRIATLQKLDQLKLDFSVPEKYAGRVGPGRDVFFTAAGDERRVQGRVYAVDPRIDEATRSVLLRAIAPNPDGRLLPGGFANVELLLDEIPDALLVPSIAIIPGVSDKTVFVAVDGKAERRTVRTGIRNESSVQILEGLKAGDLVITSGLQQLRAGLPVSVVEDSATAARGGPPAAAKKKSG